MRVLDARRGRLVQHADDVEAGASERLESDEALGGEGVRGGGDRRLEGRAVLGRGEVRAGEERSPERLEVAGDDVDQRELGAADADAVARGRFGGGEPAFERRAEGPARVAALLLSFEAEAKLSVFLGDDAGEVFLGLSSGRIK